MGKAKIFIAIILILLLVAAVGVLAIYHLYPVKYKDLVEKHAEKYGLQPEFLMAVIRAESFFKPNARSSAGAMGLMQIMPKTGTWISKKLKMEDFNVDMLFDPEVSVEMGCWYFSYLSEKYSGDEMKMLAAYNAGPGNVEKWINEDDELHHDDIQFEETQKYVRKIINAEKVYRIIYGLF